MCRRGVHIRTHDGAVASERIQSTSVRSRYVLSVCILNVMLCGVFVRLSCVCVVAHL